MGKERVSIVQKEEGVYMRFKPLLEVPQALPVPFNDLNTDARDCENGCACRCYAGIELGCMECREVIKNPSYGGMPWLMTLCCPECMETLASWRN